MKKHRESRHVILLFIPIILFGFVLYLGGLKLAPVITTHERLSRIEAIYAELRLDGSYIPQSTNIFGDKRPYVSDPGRSQSSSVTYIRGANVDDTVADLKKRIEAAGFSYFEQAYAGSASEQYHFKDARGEYVRISVSSKPRDDDIQNKFLMKQQLTADDYNMDFNAGPSNVTVKVNLDDNNE